MDTHTLLVIVITAVVTATARRLVSAIEDWLNSTVARVIESKRVRLFLSKPSLVFTVDGIVCLSFMMFVLSKFEGRTPATLADLHDLFAYSVLMTFILALSAYDAVVLRRFYARQQR